jgi:hypothetical protein
LRSYASLDEIVTVAAFVIALARGAVELGGATNFGGTGGVEDTLRGT